jgi:hypothetical protein
LDEPIHGVLSVSFLRAESPGLDDDHAVFCDPSSRQTDQALPNVRWERKGLAHVKAELNSRGDLVDILPARARGTDKSLMDFPLVN